MTRKAKIGWVMIAIGLGIAAFGVVPGRKEGELQIIYAGTDPDKPSTVYFTLTNSSNQRFGRVKECIHASTNCDTHHLHWPSHIWEFIEPNSAITCCVPTVPRDQWLLSTRYRQDMSASFVLRTRLRLSGWAENRNWHWMAQWLEPKEKIREADGPKMRDTKPLAEAQK